MKISIITPSFNSSKTILQTVESVVAQKNIELEYIIKDGASSDDTLRIIQNYSSKISQLISASDKGIYDAMNIGVKSSSGDVIGILNSDDFYAYDNALADVCWLFESSGADIVYADLDYVDEKDTSKIVRRWRSGEYVPNAFRWGWQAPHPSFFVRREVYERFGYFDDSLRISADYEFMLRVMHFGLAKVAYLPKTLVKMRTGGASGAGLEARKRAYEEDKKAWELNGLRAPFGALELKRLRKLMQWL